MTENITVSQVEQIKKAIKLIGSQERVATELGLKSQGTVSQWTTNRRPLPSKHCLKIEELTCGEVTRYDLRPDIFGDEPEKLNAA